MWRLKPFGKIDSETFEPPAVAGNNGCTECNQHAFVDSEKEGRGSVLNHTEDMLSGWRHDGAICSRKLSNAEVLAWWGNQPIVSEEEMSTPRAPIV